MTKYKPKLFTVEAEPYKEGMEDGWIVFYSGNMFSYEKYFGKNRGKERALEFIKNNGGLKDVYSEDLKCEIVYEKPAPFIRVGIERKFILQTDMIVTNKNGVRHPCSKEEFEKTYELAE